MDSSFGFVLLTTLAWACYADLSCSSSTLVNVTMLLRVTSRTTEYYISSRHQCRGNVGANRFEGGNGKNLPSRCLKYWDTSCEQLRSVNPQKLFKAADNLPRPSNAPALTELARPTDSIEEAYLSSTLSSLILEPHKPHRLSHPCCLLTYFDSECATKKPGRAKTPKDGPVTILDIWISPHGLYPTIPFSLI